MNPPLPVSVRPCPNITENTAATIAIDCDAYERAIDGIEIKAVRTGRGLGPTTVRTTSTRNCIASSVTIGFPTATISVIDDSKLVIGAIRSVPQESRWCEIDLDPGTVVAHSPGTEHIGVNTVGLSFDLVAIDLSSIEEMAEELLLDLRLPTGGGTPCFLEPSSQVGALGSAINSFTDSTPGGVDAEEAKEDDLLHRVSVALSEEPPKNGTGRSRSVDNLHVVITCKEYADAIQRVPSISELCLVAHVSERRLRIAFCEVTAMPPSQFFRFWGLDAAHRILLGADKRSPTVTHVAAGLGFWHFGRFAGRYRDLFGECPSETVAAARSSSAS